MERHCRLSKRDGTNVQRAAGGGPRRTVRQQRLPTDGSGPMWCLIAANVARGHMTCHLVLCRGNLTAIQAQAWVGDRQLLNNGVTVRSPR